MFRFSLFLTFLALSLWEPGPLTGGPSGAVDGSDILPPRVMDHPPALIPMDLGHRSFENPFVACLVRIGTDGTLLDYVVTRASDLLLVEDMERFIERCTFAPALEDGKPVASQVEVVIRLNYLEDLGLYTVSSTDHIARHVDALRAPSVLKRVGPDSLDEPLHMLERPDPVVAVGDNDQVLPGSALVEGHVNHHGELRLLRVIEADDPLIAEAALLTFDGLRFNPPTAGGVPAVVKVRLPFRQ